VGSQIVDLERQLVSVLGVCASFRSGNGGVVDQHVQLRQAKDEHVAEVGNLYQAGEVGDD
jgi:hypothetical protein